MPLSPPLDVLDQECLFDFAEAGPVVEPIEKSFAHGRSLGWDSVATTQTIRQLRTAKRASRLLLFVLFALDEVFVLHLDAKFLGVVGVRLQFNL